MLTIQILKDFGANVDEGLSRCLNNEAFYLRLVGMALTDANFDNLKQAIENKDYDKGFEYAHALKGILANLALTPIFKPASEITELLRNKVPGDYDGLVKEIFKQRENLNNLIG